MILQSEKLEHNMAKLTIAVGAEELEQAIEKAYQKNKNKISVAGFRKGKVPRKLVEKMYGEAVFYEDAANILIPDAYEKALAEYTEEVVSSPKIEVQEIQAGKGMTFTAEVAIKPEVTLGEYKGVEVAKADTEVTDEEVDEAIDKERENNARAIVITDRPVKAGDETIIDFEGFVDGVAFDGGKGENYPLTIGSGAFIPGFEEGLIGANLNEELDVNVTFPEDYQASELAGKAAVFKCTVKEIKEKELPELDDEFASEVSEFDTLEEYKADVKKNLEEKKVANAKRAKIDAAIDAVVEKATMDIPEAMISTMQKQILDEYAQNMRAQGISLEQYMQYTGVDADSLMEQLKPQAEARIKGRLVLEAVAKAENIQVSDEDFEAEIKTMAETYNMEADKVKELLGENGKKTLMEDLSIKKAQELIVDNAKEV
ncbi:MAG: trigger factor [Lachnospiraceae bacterium]|nr:trigger factor [Lachnospiraceae bacterium]